MKFEVDIKGMRELERQLSRLDQKVDVPLEGSEHNAMRAVRDQYKRKAGITLDDATLRNIVRQARGA